MSDSEPWERHLTGLPPDWAVVTIGDLGSIVGGSTPSRATARYWNGDIPWVTPGELTGLREKYLEDTREHITKAGLDSCGARLLPEETLLVTSRATIGSVALLRRPTSTNQGFKSIVFGRGAEPSFYYYLLQCVVPELERRASGTTFLEISGREFGAVRVPSPSLLEQRCIAEILDTLDEAIRKTEQLIAKLKQVKQGLLHDLLTRGIDDNGELREPIRHPEQFKDSPLGRLPKRWKVCSLLECLLGTPTNGVYKPGSAIGRGTLLVGQTSLTEERSVDFRLARRATLSSAELSHYGIVEGDILVSRVYATVEGVGQPALVPEPPESAVYESNMMRLRPNRAVITPYLLFRWLRASPVRRLIAGRVNASNQTSINQRELSTLPIGVPSSAEQQKIADLLAAADAPNAEEVRTLAKLQLLKQGLMEDLLTGRVRVTKLLQEVRT